MNDKHQPNRPTLGVEGVEAQEATEAVACLVEQLQAGWDHDTRATRAAGSDQSSANASGYASQDAEEQSLETLAQACGPPARQSGAGEVLSAVRPRFVQEARCRKIRRSIPLSILTAAGRLCEEAMPHRLFHFSVFEALPPERKTRRLSLPKKSSLAQ